ncbi:hypothetical protein [Planctellipticum variicoloris]|uniref:hypothetical protein n=1 Tax=Planctellipticum variicoloris TaxID=3064265 RepID=UPI00301419A8|nr:hypothetical protein SH412_003933 [Planctomycetaceae bacterium SH412]
MAVLLTSGCGKSDPLRRQALSGEVKLAGQPLDQGTIQFEPLDDKGIASGGLIKGGQFAIAKQAGLPAGQYRIMIFAPEAGAAIQDAMPGDTMNAPLAKERVPAKYNTQSRETIDVSDSKKNHFVFDIPAQ